MENKSVIEVKLVDAAGKAKMFSLIIGCKGFFVKPGWTERGFGTAQTNSATIDGVAISGNAWRFFESTLGLENLYGQLSKKGVDAESLLNEFCEKFQFTANDDTALSVWNDTVSPSITQDLDCYVRVQGVASEEEDATVPGFYQINVHVEKPVGMALLTTGERGEIAKAVLDCFHNHQGICMLDDFSISVVLPNGQIIEESEPGENTATSGLEPVADHVGQVSQSDLPFTLNDAQNSGLPAIPAMDAPRG